MHKKLIELYNQNDCDVDAIPEKKIEVLKKALGGIEIGYHFLSEEKATLDVNEAKDFILKNTEGFYLDYCGYEPLEFV